MVPSSFTPRALFDACAVFTGSLVHWERAVAKADGTVDWSPMEPDRHWSMKLETPETLLREMGLTLIPPAAMALRFGHWTLSELLDPRAQFVFFHTQLLEFVE